MLLLALVACAVPHASRPLPLELVTDSPIDTLLLRSVTALLADDALAGRRTGTAGARTAEAYLVSECRRLGFEPLSGDGYVQEVPLLKATIVPGRTGLRISGPGVDTTFEYPSDFLPDLGTTRTLRDFAGELAYVGQVVNDARRYRLDRATRGATQLSSADIGTESSFAPALPAVLAGPRMTVTLYRPLYRGRLLE